ncbi:MAG TPA: glutamate--tRNA ligase [bacterium]|nr:glutamate--tRNA ligase [bacterium]HOL47358.1 glutamate--tRNA ligase [bacterium]HPQ18909.1 glutamate--tRNA ligase [bacterium]
MEKIITRFPPSPTGYLHIGGARTALFNWLLAKKYNGKFILRIEDTDKERSSFESVQMILNDLKWLGLNWEEGPDIGGPHYPYFQSERKDIYYKYAEQLVKEKKAYYCFCTEEELEAARTAAKQNNEVFKYNRKCLKLSDSEKNELIKTGKKFVIRFKVPENKEIIINDVVKGEVIFNTDVLDDFIIIKSDGGAIYNFAVVVDDALMGVTHILRGDDHLSNTPKQILLYEALGFKVPVLGHVSMILGEDGQKLSKRHCATAVGEYKKQGFLKEAIINYLALLGWSPPDNREIFSVNELINLFSIEKLSKRAAIFDFTKLKWMNGQYIKKLNEDELFERIFDFIDDKYKRLFDNERLKKIVYSLREYIEKLDEINKYMSFYDWTNFSFSDESNTYKEKYDFKKLANLFIETMNEFNNLKEKNKFEFVKKFQNRAEIKGKEFYVILRILLTGEVKGPELVFLFDYLTKDELIKKVTFHLKG